MTDIPEIDKNESLYYWREMLAGAEQDEQAAWVRCDELTKASGQAVDEWLEKAKHSRNLRAKVREMEESK